MSVKAQIYVEDLKLWQINKFDPVLKEIATNFKRIVNSIKYDSVDQLTKVELTRLVAKLKVSQAAIYNEYYGRLLIDLEKFMSSSLKVTSSYTGSYIFADTNKKELKKVSDKTAIAAILDWQKENKTKGIYGFAPVTDEEEKIWSKILNEPMAVNGILIAAFIKSFIYSSEAKLENLIKMAWANKWTLKELIAAADGDETPLGTASQTRKIGVEHAAVVATVMQHVYQLSTASIYSLLADSYMWVSVIDGRTTEICLKRNHKIWQFGKGPLPPAHINCRSSVAALIGSVNDIPEETFYTWIKRQNPIFQADVLGAINARKLQEGKIKAGDLQKYESNNLLSLVEFETKVDNILQP